MNYNDYVRITKTQLIARVKRQSPLKVQLFPSKCGPSNTTWIRGTEIVLHLMDGVVMARIEADRMDVTLDAIINEFSYYNCNSELGKRVHYYVKP